MVDGRSRDQPPPTSEESEIEDVYELSPTQEGMLFHGLEGEFSGVDLEQVIADLPEALEESAFLEAWQRVIARHPILRTAFRWDGPEGPRQEVHRQAALPCRRHDWRTLTKEALEARLAALLAEDRREGIDLSRAPLQRLTLIRDSVGCRRFVWTFHHALLDGRSFPIVLREVFGAYEAIRGGGSWSAIASPRSFRDYIAWLRRLDAAAAEPFFRKMLAGFRAPTPIGSGRDASRTTQSVAAVETRLTAERTQALRSFAAANQVTLNTLLQGAWALLLQRYGGEEDVVFGATRACRRSALDGANDVVGLLINTLPLRVPVDPLAPLVPWLQALRAQQVALRPYEHTPLVKVQGWSEVPRGRALFDSIVVFENETLEASLAALGGAWADRHFLYRGQTNFPVTVIGYGDREMLLRIECDRARFSEPAGKRLLGHLTTLLESMAASVADRPLGRLPMLAEEERREMVRGAERRYEPGPCLHELFERRAATSPESVAVVCEGSSLTYRELNRRANRLAHRLRTRGVGPETLVGLSLERSLELVVGILGILKAGGAYLPLDPDYPKDRLAFMVEDAGVRVIVAKQDAARPTATGPELVYVDDEQEAPEENVASGATPSSLAYVIYTSGSTGRPKGCQVTHGNVTRLFEATDHWFGFDSRDVWTLFHSYAFDFTVWELWGALLYGGRLVVVPYWVSRSPDAFFEVLRRERVTVLNQTPSAFRQLIQADLATGAKPADLALRYVVFGGEALDLQSLRPWIDRRGDDQPQLVNMYGITETTVHVTYRRIERKDIEEGLGSVIGVPIPDLSVHVLDREGEPVPLGVPGEMYVGGAGVARGYLNRPELTSERFVPDRFSERPEARLYRSGDLARRLESGDLEYMGRIDQQVKIRGFRIELGEIEAALSQQPEVRETVVIAREEATGDRRLVAYVAAERDSGDLTEELRSRLRQTLPEYMVPAVFVFLESLPLNQNGKVDKKALPAPARDRQTARTRFVEPRSEAERVMAGIWASVLGVERVGIEDDFFELGGDSILTIHVVSRAREAGLAIMPRDLFKRPTIADLLAGVPAAGASGTTDKSPSSGAVPLTPVQCWFFEQRLAEPHHWNQAFLFQAPGDLDLERLQEALAAVAAHHDAFRLRFRKGDRWEQFYAPEPAFPALECMDLRAVPPEERERALETAGRALQERLDIENGPLARAAHFDLGKGAPGRLLVVLHHLIVDGVSWRTLVEDLEQAYDALEAGEPVRLSGRSASFQSWSNRLSERAASGAFRGSLSRWLADEPPPLPVDHVEGEDLEAGTRTVGVRLLPSETEALIRDVPRVFRTQINDVLLAALGKALGSWTGRERFRIDLEGHGREDLFPDLDMSRTVGWFTTLFPVLLEVRRGSDDGAALKSVKEQLRAIPDRGLSYGVLRYLDPSPDVAARLATHPPAGLLFNYLGQFDAVVRSSARFRFATEPCGPWHSPRGRRTHALEVVALVTEGALEVRFQYGEARYRRTTVERLAESFRQALVGLVRHCTSPGVGGTTPSDFPLVRLEQADVDRLEVAHTLEDVLPLSPIQRLYHAMEASSGGLGFEAWRLRLQGPLDAEALRGAWEDVLAFHPILRTVFVSEGLSEPVQVVIPEARPAWREEDWRARPPAAREEGMRLLLSSESELGFDIARAPLTRLVLLRLEDETYELVWSAHHLQVDGWSWPLILRDLSAFYESRIGGRAPDRESPGRYARYLAWLRESAPDSTAFWREALAGFRAPTPVLPPARSATARGGASGQASRTLPESLTEALGSLSRRRKVTLSTVVQGAWALLLGHWSGERRVTFGAAFSGRPAELPGIASMVGPCVTNLPVRVELPVERPFEEWLTTLHHQHVETSSHQYAPFDRIQEWAAIPLRLRLFESLVVFQNYVVGEGARQLGPVAIEIVSAPEQTNFPVTLSVSPGRSLELRLLFHRDRAEEATAAAMLADTEALLAAIAAAPEASLGRLLEGLPAARRGWATGPTRRQSTGDGVPRTETEGRIGAVWRELFEVEAIGLDENFFDLGGHSLLLLRAHARLREDLGRDLPVVALLRFPTVRALARHLSGEEAAVPSDVMDRARRQKEALSRARSVLGKR